MSNAPRARLGTTLLLLVALAAPAVAAADEAPPRPPTPEDYTQLFEHPDHWVLVNTSDRPIIAWMVQTRMRSNLGYEATTATGVDAYRSGLFPGGGLGHVLEPGEAVEIARTGKPWLREDHRGPGASIRRYVGAIVFENNEAIGELELIENIFERRRRLALQAAEALDAVDMAPEKLRDMPSYARVFGEIADRDEALAEIRRRAREDYQIAVDHLRPRDREILERERREGGSP